MYVVVLLPFLCCAGRIKKLSTHIKNSTMYILHSDLDEEKVLRRQQNN